MTEQDATDKLLGLVENIDRKLDAKSEADEKRFAEHATRLDGHDEKIADHDERLRTHDVQIRDQAQLFTSFGHSVAKAVDVALEAKREASQSKDEALKIVESAIRMHSASIGATVQSAVKTEIAPLVAKVAVQEATTDAQTKTLADQDVKLDKLVTLATSIAAPLAHKHFRQALFVCACIGALMGGIAAGWKAHETTTPAQLAPAR